MSPSKKTPSLSYDISRCMTPDCPKAATCLRKIAPGRSFWQSFAAYKGGEDCTHYIPEEDQE